MKCDFCGRENIPLKYESINTGLKIYACPQVRAANTRGR